MNIKDLLSGEINQDDLLRYYNATIIYDNQLPKSVRGLVFDYDNINFIVINKNLSYYKKRKTIIHELAHVELNQIGKELFEFQVDKIEDEADRYIKFIENSIKLENEKFKEMSY